MRREKFGFAPAEMVEHFLESISHVMTAIGESLRQNAPLKIDDAWLTAMHVETETLREAHESADRTFLVAVVRDARRQMDAISGQIRTAIKMAGDITPEVAREKVQKYYGEIPAGPPIAKNEEWIAKRTGTHRGTVQDRVPQARDRKSVV